MVIEDLVKRVEEGQSLSEAMSYHGEEFSEMEIGMVESGEAAGQLNKTLDNLATDIARREDIKHNIKSAMMYPVAIIGLLVVVMIVMMVFVIPKLTELFDRTASNLPLVTRIVVGTSNVMREYGLLMLVGLLLLVLIVKFAKKTEGGRYVWDNLKLGLPIFGKLFKMTYLGRFARSLANLMGSGVPIVKTLEITATSIGNEVYRKRVMLSIEDIKQGIPLAENLTDPKLFPAMLVNMVEVGEKTAQLDEIMLKLADYYENEVSVSVKGLSKIIEPLLLIIIGLSVGLVVAAIMMPIMQLSNLAGSL
jgi:type IV pilus assembly protein PilC